MVELKFQKIARRFGGWSFKKDCHAICLHESKDYIDLRGGLSLFLLISLYQLCHIVVAKSMIVLQINIMTHFRPLDSKLKDAQVLLTVFCFERRRPSRFARVTLHVRECKLIQK